MPSGRGGEQCVYLGPYLFVPEVLQLDRLGRAFPSADAAAAAGGSLHLGRPQDAPGPHCLPVDAHGPKGAHPHAGEAAGAAGLRDLVLNSRTIWLCAACETCSTRCPQGIDIALVMDALEIMAQREGIKPKVRPVPWFYKAANRGIDWFGRMYELGLMAELYARMFLAGELNLQQLFKYDVPMALKMLQTGKLKLLPSVARAKAPSKVPPQDKDTIGYYPGCSLHATGIEYDMSMRAVAEALGLTLVEPEGWVCCGTSPAHSTDHFRAIALPAKNLALMEEMGYSYVTMPCAACFSRFRIAMHELEADEGLAKRVEEATGYRHTGGMRVDNVLATFVDYVGLDRIAARVTKPLDVLKVS